MGAVLLAMVQTHTLTWISLHTTPHTVKNTRTQIATAAIAVIVIRGMIRAITVCIVFMIG